MQALYRYVMDWLVYVLRPALEESFGCKYYTGMLKYWSYICLDLL